MGAALLLEGSANATAFELYVEQILTPSLHAGQIVVMDNLRARHLRAGQDSHRGERLSTAFRDLATHLTFLPFCEAFSKLKTALRRAGARTREALEEAIAQALLTITVKSAQGWFQHCGYLLPGHERKR